MTIARQLSERISRGTYAVGQPLPPRLELAREFGVARATIDRCIEYMIATGVLNSRHGSGTYVNDPSLSRHQVALISYPDLRLPRHTSFRWQYFNYHELVEKAVREKLLKFEGLIWFRPEEQAMNEWIAPYRDKIPQVIVNRTMPGIPCVSTDHRGAYHEITLERLRRYPGVRPYFLKMENSSLVSRYRESGFVDACRETGCFYDLIYLPESFQDKVELLRRHDWGNHRPLLLISDSMQNTGAVMQWVRERGLVWQRDILYSDIDNDMPEYIWGVNVTSYIQPERKILDSAVMKMEKILNGNDNTPEHLLIFPKRRDGDT